MTHAAPTTVFVHGFLDDGEVWREVIDRRTRATPTVVADLAGMGGRPRADGPFTLARHADDVIALVDGVDGPVVLVGQSFGAQVVELVAARRPDRVVGLVLLTPVPLAGAGMSAEAAAPFLALGGDGTAQRAVREQLSVHVPSAELDRLTALGSATTTTAVAETVRAWNEGDPAGAGTSPVAAPVLVIRGERDPFVTAAVVEDGVVPRFTDVAVATVADAGHWPHLERPEAVATLLDDLVDRVTGTDGSGGRGWTAAFGARTAAAFTDTLAADVVLRASALRAPVEGREEVSAVMAAASGLYSSLSFTHEARQGPRTYLEWVATLPDGTELGGVTRLLADDAGRTVDVAIHHRPLDGLLHFSDELGRRLEGRVAADRFHRA